MPIDLQSSSSMTLYGQNSGHRQRSRVRPIAKVSEPLESFRTPDHDDDDHHHHDGNIQPAHIQPNNSSRRAIFSSSLSSSSLFRLVILILSIILFATLTGASSVQSSVLQSNRVRLTRLNSYPGREQQQLTITRNAQDLTHQDDHHEATASHDCHGSPFYSILDDDHHQNVASNAAAPAATTDATTQSKFSHHRSSSLSSAAAAAAAAPRQVRLRICAFNRTFTLHLEENVHLLADHLNVVIQRKRHRTSSKSHDDDRHHDAKEVDRVLHRLDRSSSDRCQFHGTVSSMDGGGSPSSSSSSSTWAAITLCRHGSDTQPSSDGRGGSDVNKRPPPPPPRSWLEGMFSDGLISYHLHSEVTHPARDPEVYIFRSCDIINNSTASPFQSSSQRGDEDDDDDDDLETSSSSSSSSPGMNIDHHHHHLRVKRGSSSPKSVNSHVLADPLGTNESSRWVELVLVNDYQQFVIFNQSIADVIDRSKSIVNVVNSIYNQLNIYVALVGVVIWNEKDEITFMKDGEATLQNFLKYRREVLLPLFDNDNSQLITGHAFDSGVVGKALKGPICTYEFSGGVNTDQTHHVGMVATTVAHEMGHNFGMEHDSDECHCPDEKLRRCIMAPSSTQNSPSQWSDCSRRHLTEAFAKGMDFCLRNRPATLVGPVCGNGFLEEGEECDCGLGNRICDACCAANCTLKPHAACGSGVCCDLRTCSPMEAGLPCRATTGECDLPETCDGVSEHCPADVHVHDGTPCQAGEAFCAHGRCRTHTDQCQILWGPTGKVSNVQCYDQNRNGNVNGDCGYYWVNKTYFRCPAEHVTCGRLHCSHMNERLEFGLESAARMGRSYIKTPSHIFPCRTVAVDLGLTSIDPGMVPDGAKCGREHMCYGRRCVPADHVFLPYTCPGNCNGNGLCDNLGTCHCFQGYGGSDCGGSLGTLTFFWVFLLLILPLTGLSVFVAYHFHGHIKTWWFLSSRQTRRPGGQRPTSSTASPPPPAAASRLCRDQISKPIPQSMTTTAAGMEALNSQRPLNGGPHLTNGSIPNGVHKGIPTGTVAAATSQLSVQFHASNRHPRIAINLNGSAAAAAAATVRSSSRDRQDGPHPKPARPAPSPPSFSWPVPSHPAAIPTPPTRDTSLPQNHQPKKSAQELSRSQVGRQSGGSGRFKANKAPPVPPPPIPTTANGAVANSTGTLNRETVLGRNTIKFKPPPPPLSALHSTNGTHTAAAEHAATSALSNGVAAIARRFEAK